MENSWQALRLRTETFPTGRLGCNTTLIYPQNSTECIVVDPGDDGPGLIKQLEIRKLKPILLLHTHAHFDHIACSDEIKKTYGCPMCLHPGDFPLYAGLERQGAYFGMKFPAPGVIDEAIEDEQSYKAAVKAIFTPGHTPGSCSFYLETADGPVLLSGDTLFSGSIGRTDLPGGDFDLIQKSIKQRLYPLADETRVVPGHGPDTLLWQEKKSNPFVRA